MLLRIRKLIQLTLPLDAVVCGSVQAANWHREREDSLRPGHDVSVVLHGLSSSDIVSTVAAHVEGTSERESLSQEQICCQGADRNGGTRPYSPDAVSVA